jgi:HEAT repeat protein
MILGRAATVILLLAFVSPSWARAMPQVGNEGRDPDVKRLVDQLWSAADDVRTKAKAALATAGRRAAPQLISLLGDLADHYYEPHFAKGTSADEGVDITKRLIRDCFELLGDMRSAEAVPAMVRIMEQPPVMLLGKGIFAWQTQALAKIGKPAIAPLLEAMRDAALIAASIARDPKRGESLYGGPDSVADLIQARAATILGEIGDPVALPALRRVRNGGELSEGAGFAIDEAIRKIHNRSASATPQY